MALLERQVGRLDAHAVVDDGGDAGGLERREHRGDRRQPGDDRVGDHQGPAHAQVGEIHPDLARDAGAEPDAGGGHLEGEFVLHGEQSTLCGPRPDRSGSARCYGDQAEPARPRPKANLELTLLHAMCIVHAVSSKTISLKKEAYDRLRAARRYASESVQ